MVLCTGFGLLSILSDLPESPCQLWNVLAGRHCSQLAGGASRAAGAHVLLELSC